MTRETNMHSLVDTIWYVVKTAVITVVVFMVVLFVLALILPFVFCGPNDPFWTDIFSDRVTYENGLVGIYLNILRWLALSALN